jgi:molybdopterin converting factor small subunit
MAQVHLPRSLAALFPGIPRRLQLEGDDVATVLRALDAAWPGAWDRVCQSGPRIREHMNVFVDGIPAGLETPVGPTSIVHVIPAVSGGSEQGGGGQAPERPPTW